MNKNARLRPCTINGRENRFPFDKTVNPGKKSGLLPLMGWNSWNAFGSGNTEELTKQTADQIIALGLDKLGYQYVILDDGCYKSERVNGKLSNEEVKFPSGFRALADYIHAKDLKFGMYNDIGDRLCAGAWVGTCGYEEEDAQSYIDWDIDFIKVDNCYYLWDNATFANPENAQYTFAPKIQSIKLSGNGIQREYHAVTEGRLTGTCGVKTQDYVHYIGTIDGTNVGTTPVGPQWGELEFTVEVPSSGEYEITLHYLSGKEEGTGNWLQLAVGDWKNEVRYYDDLLDEVCEFADSKPIKLTLNAGKNVIRIMNHRRQENTLNSYSTLLNEMNAINPDHHILLSTCEWGKTQPQNWAYKLAVSWRILNDITFAVGADGDWGHACWESDNTASITSQYNKAVVMWKYAGLEKGWNDPDMMVIGMNGLTLDMNKTHMAMWCMMNAPLMLGLDLRRIQKGDELYEIIANEELIALNQDPLGIQARRIFTSLTDENVDLEYITNNDRVDILAKPLANGDIALSFLNLSSEEKGSFSITVQQIVEYLGYDVAETFQKAEHFTVKDLWSKNSSIVTGQTFTVDHLPAHGNITLRISAK